MKLIDRHEFSERRVCDSFTLPRVSDALIFKCQCRCVCDNQRPRTRLSCGYCLLTDHAGSSLIGPPKPSRFAEQRIYVFDDGGYETR